MFIYSLKLFGSNWVKALKFFLYYIVIWGICFALLVPVFFEFKNILLSNIKSAELLVSLNGVFQGTVGVGLHNLIGTSFQIFLEAFNLNVGLALYGLIVLFVVLPFLINVGKYTFCEMLYSYMTSKNKIGFWSALFRGLKKSVLFALLKTIYNLFFCALTLVAFYGIGMVEDAFFVTWFLPIVEFVVLVLLFTLNEMIVLGWMPALIVFNCNVFKAFSKGLKAVKRHFCRTFASSFACFFVFWLIIMIFGFYSLVVLVPLITVVLCVQNMAVFFSSQGMRFYFTKNNILTPKKLEEVDNINKTAYIL